MTTVNVGNLIVEIGNIEFNASRGRHFRELIGNKAILRDSIEFHYWRAADSWETMARQGLAGVNAEPGVQRVLAVCRDEFGDAACETLKRLRDRLSIRLDCEPADVSLMSLDAFLAAWKGDTVSVMKDCEIVLFAANPAGTDRLALDDEVRAIESKILAAKHRENMKLISKWAVRPDDLLQALNQHDATVIHFSGHGSASDEIILVDDDGSPKPVSKAAMSALLKTLGGNVRLVVLNACFSKPQAEAIVEHIDCAIGMNKAIGDNAAITFAASLYRAIGFGKSIQEAFDQGVTAMLLEGSSESQSPELFVKLGVDPKQVFPLNP